MTPPFVDFSVSNFFNGRFVIFFREAISTGIRVTNKALMEIRLYINIINVK